MGFNIMWLFNQLIAIVGVLVAIGIIAGIYSYFLKNEKWFGFLIFNATGVIIEIVRIVLHGWSTQTIILLSVDGFCALFSIIMLMVKKIKDRAINNIEQNS